jgi:hypothetical protein
LEPTPLAGSRRPAGARAAVESGRRAARLNASVRRTEKNDSEIYLSDGEQEMSAKRRFGLRRLFVVLASALLIAWAFAFLAEHLSWHLFSEAGGQIVRTTF